MIQVFPGKPLRNDFLQQFVITVRYKMNSS